MWTSIITLTFLATCSLALGLATNVRLVHGDNHGLKPYEGAVEVLVNGSWGPILRHGIDDVTTKTICRMLGYGYVGFLVQRFAYPGTPLLNQLKCLGNETSIAECIQEPSDYRAVFYDSPGVHCFDHVFTDVRIVGRGPPNSGSVQVKMDGRWGRVCDYNSIFGVMKAPAIDEVICRTLGYERNDPKPQRGGGYGVQLSWVDLDFTSCNGTETSFNQCTFRPVTMYQPGCYAIRAVTCITRLHGACTSDAICAAQPNAACRNHMCVCKQNYKETTDAKCVAQ